MSSGAFLNNPLRQFLGISKALKGKQLPISWHDVDAIFVHCNLVGSSTVVRASLAGTVRSDILARFGVATYNYSTLLRI